MPSAIELRGVSARYGRSHHGARGPEDAPLADVTLAVEPGELVAVLGPNGAGKTTLLRVLGGTLAPSAGSARLFGVELASMERRDIARSVAIVSQFEQVAFAFTVRDVVMMGRAPHQDGWMQASAEDRAIVEETLVLCDLSSLAARPVMELSGGEQKRVAIARALAQRTRVLLLDEPAAFLDVRHQVALYELLTEAIATMKIACVVVMHDLNVAAEYASRVALFKGGRMIAMGAVEDVMTYARLRETFETDLYVGVNELTQSRFFLPMRGNSR